MSGNHRLGITRATTGVITRKGIASEIDRIRVPTLILVGEEDVAVPPVHSQRAVRQFTDEPLSEEAIRSILNAGRRAQSSKNTQPWHFIAIRDRETLQQLSQCGAYAGHLAGAPFAVALISSTNEGFDLGQAAAYMQLAAWGLGIGSCIASMWGPCPGDR